VDLLDRIKQHLVTQRLLKRGARVVVAVSGGLDSMTLLHALKLLAADFGWKLSVAHFNHQLRGRSSKADEALVSKAAHQLKLPCDVGAADVRAVAQAQGVSVEMAARELRHAFLAKCARKRRARTVALAHHADDQAELFLLRLLRGAGGEGLAGMKALSASPAARGDARPTRGCVMLVRPLLDFSKNELADFARELGIGFREDASNASTEHLRNWVRLELLPSMAKRQPAIVRTVLRAMELAGADAECVTEVAKDWLKQSAVNPSLGLAPALKLRRTSRPPSPRTGVVGQASSLSGDAHKSEPRHLVAGTSHRTGRMPVPLPKGPPPRASRFGGAGRGEGRFAQLPAAVQRRVVQLRLRALGVEPDFQLVEELRRADGKRISAGVGIFVTCDRQGVIRKMAASRRESFSQRQCEVRIADDSGAIAFVGGKLRWRLRRCPSGFSVKPQAGIELFDADKVGVGFRLRHWRAGDRFQPIGLRQATKLQDWFTNRKVPVSRRHELVLAETERGEICWVEGERIGEVAKVTASTRRLLEWHWRRL